MKNKKLTIPFLATIGGIEVTGPTGLRTEFSSPNALGALISRAFLFTLPLIGIVGFLFLLWSGFQFLTSKGDPKALASAQARMTYTIIGLIIVFLAYSITSFTSSLFGLNQP